MSSMSTNLERSIESTRKYARQGCIPASDVSEEVF
jgi:hypothetical protein